MNISGHIHSPASLHPEPPEQTKVKYRGLHLDRKITWKAHIQAKKQQLTTKARNMNWIIGINSKLSIANKLLIYKTILTPIWTYGIELWGCSKPSNTKILQTFQSKMLLSLTNAPWFVSNQTLHADLGIPYINEVINNKAIKYGDRIVDHDTHRINELAVQPLANRRPNLGAE
jgi:hypothetical protein